MKRKKNKIPFKTNKYLNKSFPKTTRVEFTHREEVEKNKNGEDFFRTKIKQNEKYKIEFNAFLS